MRQENPAAMLSHRIDGKQASVRDSLQKNDWFFPLDDACRRELSTVIEELRANPLPLLLLTPEMFVTGGDMFRLAACRALAARVRHALKEGVSFAVLDEVFSRPELIAEHDMQPGQIQYVNNREIGHCRTAFTDHEQPERRRYLVRMWLRDEGHRGYRG